MEHRFSLNSNECETLLAFEEVGSLQRLADVLGRDISVVSRNLKSIAEKSETLIKEGGRWTLTAQGKSLNQWTREAIYAQRLALNQQQSLKIASTREFASRILLPKVRDLLGDSNVSVSIVSTDQGIENSILSGEVDFGFDCGIPHDPSIAFKRVTEEPFVLVASPKFIKKHSIKSFTDLREHDRLKFSRSEITIVDIDIAATRYFGTFSDIASLRQAATLGYGWTVLPYYCVADELKAKKLKRVEGLNIQNEKYGVWWLRDRKNIQPWVARATKWLKAINLGE